ncbi:MAG: elongation factor P [candidate division WOR-3 bacterium]|nr:elongation factor P [candidate division WOR-3 bacterium]
MITPNDFRPGLLVRYRDDIWEIVEYQRVKIAQRRAFVRTTFRHLLTGKTIEENLSSEEKLEELQVERRKCQYLYNDGENYHFMELEHYDQFALSKEILGDKVLYLTENTIVDILYVEAKPLTIEVPNFVELTVVETEPDYKGDTATGGGKPAKLETGLVISVPFFIKVGDKIRIDTRSNSYVERV